MIASAARIYATLWLVALVGAGVGRVEPLAAGLRSWLALPLRPGHAGLAQLFGLATHNAFVAGWPLAVERVMSQSCWVWRCAVLSSLALNAIVVGLAFGAYGVKLVPWLPHLPLELLALSVGASGAVGARTRLSIRLLVLVVTVLAAAAVEVWGTPR